LIEMFVWSQQSKSKGLKPQNLVQPYFFAAQNFLSDTNDFLIIAHCAL